MMKMEDLITVMSGLEKCKARIEEDHRVWTLELGFYFLYKSIF